MSRVIDGDTIVVDTVGTVRLIGVDTPETVDPGEPVGCFGPEASSFTRAVATGQMVRLEFDVDRTDRFGRTLAYVYLPDEVFLNATLVQQGYGYAYTVFPFRYLEQFTALEREARESRRGLWEVCASRQFDSGASRPRSWPAHSTRRALAHVKPAPRHASAETSRSLRLRRIR